MPAEIIAIGTELTTGAKLDTNSQWLSHELAALGIPVHYHTTVADDLEANIGVLRTAAARADLVLITGGLGPTLDDLTRDALAALAGVKLVRDEPSLEAIHAMFARRNREMPARNVVQAMFPEGSEPLPNRSGTAPGIWLELNRPDGGRCRIAALPGVPSEMKIMYREQVVPRLERAGTPGIVIRHARINCFGLGESAAEELLGDVTARGRDPEVGITVHEATITLRIVAHAPAAEEAVAKIAATKEIIRERLGEYVFGEEDDELEHVVVRLLAARGQTVATAETGTGGLVAHRLTEVRGGSACYSGGLVVASPRFPFTLAGLAQTPGVPGRHAARDMALGCRRTFDVDFALAVSAPSRADDRESEPTAPLAWIALADEQGVDVRELNIAGDPAIVKSRLAKSVLNLLRLKLIRGS